MATNWLATFASHDSAGTLFENTIGVKMDPSSGDGLNATDLASAINDWVGASYLGCLSGLLTLDTITVRKMPEPTADVGVKAVGLTGTSGNSDNDLPRELSVILAWKTDHAGRSGRGHIALPALRATSLYATGGQTFNMSGGVFSTKIPAFFSDLDDGFDWGIGGADGHLSHIVYSRVHDAGYDVKARIIRSTPRWVERRQTAP